MTVAATTLRSRVIPTPLGEMTAVSDGEALRLLEFANNRRVEIQMGAMHRYDDRAVEPGDDGVLSLVAAELVGYFAGTLTRFTVPLRAPGTPFQLAVWDELIRIPYGQTRAYSQVAAAIGRPTSVRATARANGDNRIALIIPCHRVIGADGTLTGYGGGLDRKEWLLAHEGVRLKDGRTLWSV